MSLGVVSPITRQGAGRRAFPVHRHVGLLTDFASQTVHAVWVGVGDNTVPVDLARARLLGLRVLIRLWNKGGAFSAHNVVGVLADFAS